MKIEIKDNHSNMCRQLLIDDRVVFSITAMKLKTKPLVFPDHWHPEWKTLMALPWGVHQIEEEMEADQLRNESKLDALAEKVKAASLDNADYM